VLHHHLRTKCETALASEGIAVDLIRASLRPTQSVSERVLGFVFAGGAERTKIEPRSRGPQHVPFLHVLGWWRDGTLLTQSL